MKLRTLLLATWCASWGFMLPAQAAQHFLKPVEAFNVTLQAVQGQTAVLHFHIAKGYYLYRRRIHIAAVAPASLGSYELPAGIVDDIPYYGKTVVLPKSFDLRVPVQTSQPPATLTVGFQGCAVNGICYPPRTVSLPVAASAATPVSHGHSVLLELLAAFGAGLLLTFTPCVLPMVPILSSVIVGQGVTTSRWRTAGLSLTYVLGTATTYAGIGALAGATGNQLQAYFENVWGIGILSTIFILLALSMFGLYELQMPAAFQSRLQDRSQNVRRGSLVGSYVLGLLSALIVGACVSPLAISLLTVAISQHSPALGAALMVAMALGMGVFLVLLGLGAGFLLPRAGAWMDQVKRLFGFLLLGVAIYLLSGLPEVPVLGLWALWLITAGVALGATHQSTPQSSGWLLAAKGLGSFLLLWGAMALFGALEGGVNVLHPLPPAAAPVLLQGSTSGAAAAATGAPTRFHRVTTPADLDRWLARAQAAHRPAFVDFYASWCTDCVRLERETLADARVGQALGPFVLIQADVTRNDAGTQALKQRFGIFGPPALIFFGAGGHERKDLTAYGYMGPTHFVALLQQVTR